jgi:hypothetical protein
MRMRNLAWQALASLAAVAVLLTLAAPADAAPSHKKRYAKHHVIKHRAARTGPYGFLPGYRPPEVIERQRRERFYATGQIGRPYYAVPWPRFHRGRWNGGGFGPCYTYTPIGPVWNCGR